MPENEIVKKETPKNVQSEIVQGMLDLLVLKAVGPGPLRGLRVSRRIEQITKGTFTVKPGSLFPALRRIEAAAGFIHVGGVRKVIGEPDFIS
jgi:DNA-binding PadR family transcriptional regulator